MPKSYVLTFILGASIYTCFFLRVYTDSNRVIIFVIQVNALFFPYDALNTFDICVVIQFPAKIRLYLDGYYFEKYLKVQT